VRATTRTDYLDRIRRVLRFVQDNLDEPLTPDRLADVANQSVFHFHRIFRGLVGESLTEHVRRLRLERAAGELRRTERRVIEVALSAGYEAHEPFTRAFRAHFGMSPSEYRREPEPLVFPPALCGVHYGTDDAVSRFVALQEGSQMIEVRLETLPARRLLALAHRGDYHTIGATFERLNTVAASRGLLGPESVSLGIYYDDPETTPVDSLRSHACVSVSDALRQAPEGFELLPLDGGEFAIGVHRGGYQQLAESYRWLFGEWLPSSGREAAHAPCHETYVNDARTTPASELVTHICVPLVPVDAAVVSR
jgi:AraC family transcriptional regulator